MGNEKTRNLNVEIRKRIGVQGTGIKAVNYSLTYLSEFAMLRLPPTVRRFFNRMFGTPHERCIVDSAMPLRLNIDPANHAGSTLLRTGHYEPETERLFRDHLRPGDKFLDIGANEGILSAYAGTLVGEQGLVVAIEPQSSLQPLIEITLALNGIRPFKIYHRAIGGDEDTSARINLYPTENTGQASLVRKPRWGWTTFVQRSEPIRFISIERIFTECQIDHFDLVKVDVEGFEHQVVEAMLPHITAGRVRKLLLDYHTPILRRQGIDPLGIHQSLLDARMQVRHGNPSDLNSYLLYEFSV